MDEASRGAPGQRATPGKEYLDRDVGERPIRHDQDFRRGAGLERSDQAAEGAQRWDDPARVAPWSLDAPSKELDEGRQRIGPAEPGGVNRVAGNPPAVDVPVAPKEVEQGSTGPQQIGLQRLDRSGHRVPATLHRLEHRQRIGEPFQLPVQCSLIFRSVCSRALLEPYPEPLAYARQGRGGRL